MSDYIPKLIDVHRRRTATCSAQDNEQNQKQREDYVLALGHENPF